MRKFLYLLTVLLLVGGSGIGRASPAFATSIPTPGGFKLIDESSPAPGVEFARFTRRDQVQVAVAKIAPGADVSLNLVHSDPNPNSPKQALAKTSDMCGDCVLAINGDFFDVRSGTNAPVGPVMNNEQPLKTLPQVSGGADDGQLSILAGGNISTLRLMGQGKLLANDMLTQLQFRVNPLGQVNPTGLVMYQNPLNMAARPKGALLLKAVDPAGRSPQPRQPTLVQVVKYLEPVNVQSLGADEALLGGYGAAAAQLKQFWNQVATSQLGDRAYVRWDYNVTALDALGCWPVLLREGKVVATPSASEFYRLNHSRTAIGNMPDGSLLLAVMSGKPKLPNTGVNIPQEISIMQQLGTTEAINCDGGGSSTMVVRGKGMVSQPHDGVERPVREALALKVGKRTLAPRPNTFKPGNGFASPGEVALPLKPVAFILSASHQPPLRLAVLGLAVNFVLLGFYTKRRYQLVRR